MELNIWTKTKISTAAYDQSTGTWTVELERDGQKRELKPKHMIVATGLNGGKPIALPWPEVGDRCVILQNQASPLSRVKRSSKARFSILVNIRPERSIEARK